MASSKKKNSAGFSETMYVFFTKNKRYIYAAACFVCIIFILVFFTNGVSTADPMAGVYQEFKEDENDELKGLINNYYTACAAGDIASLEAYAKPVSDSEKSYIKFFSKYVEAYKNIKTYSKRGADDSSYLVSVYMEIKFKDLDTVAPGLDFFYVKTDENGTYYIDNTYSAYNQSNNEIDMDTNISALIAAYEEQKDVVELKRDVQEKCNAAYESDDKLNKFVNNTLVTAIAQWKTNYLAQKEQQEAIAAAKEKEEKQKAEKAAQEEKEKKEAEKKAAEEEANATYVITTSKVNVRKSPSENGEQLGKIDANTKLKKYAEENDWSKIDYNGTKAYVKSEFLKPADDEKKDDEKKDDENRQDENPGENNTANANEGKTITLTNTVNVRSDMSETASKVAVAYAGEPVTVVKGDTNGWTKISYKGKEGYIKTEYLK